MKKIEVRYREPGGIIWKVLTDEDGKHLVIESRDAERRRTLLSVLSISAGEFLTREIPAPKPWWIGLKAVGSGKAIFQGYKESQSPEPQGVYALDLISGKILWQDETKSFESFSAKDSVTLLGKEEDQTLLYQADLSSGKITGSLKEGEFPVYTAAEDASVFPFLYSEDNTHYPTIADFIRQNGYKNTGPIEYLEHAGKILVSFYIQEGKKLTNILLIADEEGNILLEDLLTEGSEGIGMSSYFICNSTLIYIKNKTSIALAAIS